MRAWTVTPLACLLLLAVVLPSVQGQSTSPAAFDVAVAVPMEAQEPGNRTPLKLTIGRHCPNAVTVLDQQTVGIAFKTPEGAVVDGPKQAVFPQQLCAQQQHLALEVDYAVTVPRQAATAQADANGSAWARSVEGDGPAYAVTILPDYAGPLSPGGPEASATFTILVKGPQPMAAVVEPAELEAPSPAFAIVGLALLAVAVALRRRA